MLRLNPRPLAGCQWTTAKKKSKATAEHETTDRTTCQGTGVVAGESVGSGLARARATVKPSANTALDRRHYKRNALYAEVGVVYTEFF